MNKKWIWSLLFIFTLAQGGHAAQQMFGKLCLSVGAGFFDLGLLNQRLQAYSFPVLPQEFFQMGAFYQLINNNVLIDIEYFEIFARSTYESTIKTSLWGTIMSFSFGYQLVPSDWFHFYPLVGVGWSQMNLSVTEDSTPTFNSILAIANRHINMDKGDLLGLVGAGIDFLISNKNRDKTKQPGFIIGLRGGYSFPISQGQWQANGEDATDGPEVSFSGPFIRLIIGMWE